MIGPTEGDERETLDSPIRTREAESFVHTYETFSYCILRPTTQRGRKGIRPKGQSFWNGSAQLSPPLSKLVKFLPFIPSQIT